VHGILSESSLMPDVRVKDLMRSPVRTVSDGETVDKAAQIMAEYKIGSVVVLDMAGRPIGIVTERDLVRRVLARKLSPSKVKVRDVMSSPLITVSPRATVDQAARKMGKLGIRKLVVVDRGKMVGIITSRELIEATPMFFDIIYEKLRSGVMPSRKAGERVAGYCESCGQWSESLVEVNGSFLCEDCAAEAGGEE